MKLVLAEKPSVAQSIAKVLGANKRGDGYLEGNDYLVSWCVGHLVELAQPEAYDAKYSKWSYADLPILPDDWKYEVSAGTRKQFGILKKLMARGDVESLVCATDVGRILRTFKIKKNVEVTDNGKDQLFEELGGKYERQGDYLIPCLTVPAEEEQAIGIWGQRHLDYLKQYRKVTYTNLLTSGRLNAYLADINRQAQERFERLIEGMKQAQGITEQLKAENALEWTGCLNNIRACAREIVEKEIIFA